MKCAKNPLRDSYREILILVAVLLVHLTLFLAFRHQVVWPSPPVSNADFVGFKMAPPPPVLTNAPPTVSPPAVILTPPNPVPEVRLPQIHLSMSSSVEAATNGTPTQPRDDSEAPGYFAVPRIANEAYPGLTFGPAFSYRYFGAPDFQHYHPGGADLTSPTSRFHVQFGDLRKTVPH